MKKMAIGIVAALTAAVLLLCGCSGQERNTAANLGESSQKPVHTVVLLGTGARAGTPQMGSLPTALESSIQETLSTKGAFDLVVIDGEPAALGSAVLSVEKNTAEAQAASDRAMIGSVTSLLKTSKASEPETNLYEALRAGAKDLASMPAGEKRLFVLDSLISTAGLYKYSDDGMTMSSDAEEVAAWVNSIAAGDLDLSGVDVYVAYAGEVAGSQERPSSKERANLKEQFEKTCLALGANSVTFLDDPITKSAGTADEYVLPEVTPVKVSAEDSFANALDAADDSGEIVLDETTLGFVTGTADFSDPEEAHATITLAAGAIESKGWKVKVQGECASWGSAQYRKDISQARAEAVASALIEAGLPGSSIVSCEGVGSDGEKHVKDTDESGNLVPALAQKNRVVRLIAVG